MRETVEELRECMRVAAMLRRHATAAEDPGDFAAFLAAARALEACAQRLAFGHYVPQEPAPPTVHVDFKC